MHAAVDGEHVRAQPPLSLPVPVYRALVCAQHAAHARLPPRPARLPARAPAFGSNHRTSRSRQNEQNEFPLLTRLGLAWPPVAQMRPNEWEQKAYQLLVVRYLIGLGDDLAPLRYRLLPPAAYINIEYYEERQRTGMAVEGMVGVHCGYLKEEVPPTCYPLLTAHRPPATHCSLLTAHCLLLTAHCSLLTTHYSLLTACCGRSGRATL